MANIIPEWNVLALRNVFTTEGIDAESAAILTGVIFEGTYPDADQDVVSYLRDLYLGDDEDPDTRAWAEPIIAHLATLDSRLETTVRMIVRGGIDNPL